ncbi:hypothetical protein KC19_12G120200 [Ceratodon purpureus]|uniref:Secreted protein n=1 Tax=Ceratodon purpureus TaxID=3225 RepID=A0A8T0G707_CERPU|nr:hypothetical protein KC19_12G120200 [Ceratodon purpureus]
MILCFLCFVILCVEVQLFLRLLAFRFQHPPGDVKQAIEEQFCASSVKCSSPLNSVFCTFTYSDTAAFRKKWIIECSVARVIRSFTTYETCNNSTDD